MKTMILTLTSLMMMGQGAMADQCMAVSQAQANLAAQILKNATTIQSFCAPCGDTAAKVVNPYSIDTQTFVGSFAVSINGQVADLAYTYVNGINLAAIVGCPTTGVSSTLN